MNLIFTFITSSVICFLFFFLKTSFMALGESNLDEYHLEKTHDLELKPMFIMDLGGQVSEENFELKEFFDKYNSLCGSAVKKYDSLLKIVINYVQRYLSLFLIKTGVSDQEGKDLNEMIVVDFEIIISPEDLAYLQNFSKISKESSVLKDLSRLDAILSKIIRRRERSYFERALRFSISLLYYLCLGIHRIFLLSNFYNFTPFLTILLVTWFMYRFSSRRSFYFYLGVIINSMIFWESLNLYRKKIKDVEIELETLKLQKMPAECDPANTWWYHSVKNFFFGDRCLEYLKKINRNPLDEVSLLQSIFDTYSFYTVQTAFRILGASVRDFTGEITASYPKPLHWFVTLPLVPFTTILVALSILILFGKKVRLSFFGASIEVGDSSAIKETRIINKRGPRLIAGYRPLRILAKSRFFRRSELDLANEMKSDFKAPELECAIECKENNDVQPSTASDSEIAKKRD